MDYRYIEQLLDRYWDCETSLEEERILRAFFSQEEVPVHLAKYQSLFKFQSKDSQTELSEDFDNRLLGLIGEQTGNKKEVVIKAQRLTLNYRLRPLYRAAAVVAIFLLVGGAIQHTFQRPGNPTGWDYNMANYQDTYKAPQEAFEAGMGGIEDIQELLRTMPNNDSLKNKMYSKALTEK